MKNRKRIISLLCAVVMIFAMAVPALAAEAVPFSAPDYYPYQNYEFNNENYFPFSTTNDQPYFRVAVRNGTDASMTLRIYKVINGREESTPYQTTTIKAGEWGGTSVIYCPSTSFAVRLISPAGITPKGEITVRLSTQTFSRTLDWEEAQ